MLRNKLKIIVGAVALCGAAVVATEALGHGGGSAVHEYVVSGLPYDVSVDSSVYLTNDHGTGLVRDFRGAPGGFSFKMSIADEESYLRGNCQRVNKKALDCMVGFNMLKFGKAFGIVWVDPLNATGYVSLAAIGDHAPPSALLPEKTGVVTFKPFLQFDRLIYPMKVRIE